MSCGTAPMIELIAGMDAESPMTRYPAGGFSSGTSNGTELMYIAEMDCPGCACRAHCEAGPDGSWSTKSRAKVPASASASAKV